MRSQAMFRTAPLAALLAALALPAVASDFDPATATATVTGAIVFDDLVDIPRSPPGVGEVAPGVAPGAVVDVPVPAPAFGAAVATERLDAMRGGDGNVSTTTNRADIRGNVGGNSATNVTGGGNGIADGSFGNAAGISTVIQNSGSNVLIQNSTIVNVQFVPTP